MPAHEQRSARRFAEIRRGPGAYWGIWFSSTERSARYGTWVFASIYLAALVFGAINLAGRVRAGQVTVYAVASMALLAIWAGYIQVAWWRRTHTHTPVTNESSEASDRVALPPAARPHDRMRTFESLVTLCLPFVIYMGQVANDAALGRLTSSVLATAAGSLVFWLILMGCLMGFLWNMLRSR